MWQSILSGLLASCPGMRVFEGFCRYAVAVGWLAWLVLVVVHYVYVYMQNIYFDGSPFFLIIP